MKPWLVAIAVLLNGVAWWWFDSQRTLRLAVPPPKIDVGSPTAPKLLLLSEVTAPPRASARPASNADPIAEPRVEPVPPAMPQPADLEKPQAPVRPAPQATAETEPGDCVMLGSIDRNLLVTWSDTLRGAEMQVGEIAETSHQELITGYRVYFPAGSRPQTDIEVLRDAGIDALSVVEPGTNPRVSAGVFAVHSNALRRQQELHELGYAAEIIPISRETTVFWTQVNGPQPVGDRAATRLNDVHRDAYPVWRSCATPAAPTATRRDLDGLGGQH